MNNNIDILMKDLAVYTRMVEEMTGIVDGIKDEIKEYMAAHNLETVYGAEHKATWKTVQSTRIDTTAIKKELPDIATRYSKTTTTKRFTFA